HERSADAFPDPRARPTLVGRRKFRAASRRRAKTIRGGQMASAIRNWGEIIRTQNLSPDKAMDPVSRWLLITRASVFPMTILSGLIGGLFAARVPRAAPPPLHLARAGPRPWP